MVRRAGSRAPMRGRVGCHNVYTIRCMGVRFDCGSLSEECVDVGCKVWSEGIGTSISGDI